MKTRMNVCGPVLVVLIGMGNAASDAAISENWALRTAGGVQVAVNGVNINTGTTSDGYRPRRLTLNPFTGMLYLSQYKYNGTGASGVRMYDSAATSPVTLPSEATAGQLDGAANEFIGSVQSGSQGWDIGTGRPVAFNPNFSNSDGTYVGAVASWVVASGGVNQFRDFVPQSSARNWGELEEGTVLSPRNDGAMFAEYNVYGSMNTASASGAGIAYLDRRNNTSSVLVDRYAVFLFRLDGSYDFGLYVSEVSTNVTGASNTAAGTRTASSQGKVMSHKIDFAGLVPGVADESYVRDIAVRPVGGDDFDVYFLSYDNTNFRTCLSAVRATLPAAKSGWSWTQLDISGDPDDGVDYLELRDMVANIDIAGMGIAFSANGNTLYVASEAALSTGNATYDDGRIYMLDRVVASPKGTMVMLQ